jgi:hypothetical protein
LRQGFLQIKKQRTFFWLRFVTGLIQNVYAASDEKQKCKKAAYKVLDAKTYIHIFSLTIFPL